MSWICTFLSLLSPDEGRPALESYLEESLSRYGPLECKENSFGLD